MNKDLLYYIPTGEFGKEGVPMKRYRLNCSSRTTTTSSPALPYRPTAPP